MSTCGACKYRGENIETFESDASLNRIPSTFFICQRIKHYERNNVNPDDSGKHALVIDASGYYGALCVEDDFGCNLWESK